MACNEDCVLLLMWAHRDHPHPQTPGRPLMGSKEQPLPPSLKHTSYSTAAVFSHFLLSVLSGDITLKLRDTLRVVCVSTVRKRKNIK